MRDDIKIHYIDEPGHNYNKHLVFSIRNKNNLGYKYYIMNIPNDKNNKLELKRIDNAILLLGEIQTKPISIKKEKEEYLTAIGLLELAIKDTQSESAITIKEMLDNKDTLDKIKSQREKISAYTSNISIADAKAIKDTIKK